MNRLLLILIVIFCLFPNILEAAPVRQYQGEITSPRPNAVLRGQVVIEGTAYHPELWKYEVWFTPGLNPNVPDDQWIRILVKEEQAILNGQLAIWNTTIIADGVYTLRLRVVRRDGNWEDVNIFPLNIANSTPPTPVQAPATATLPIPPTPPPTIPPPTALPVLTVAPTPTTPPTLTPLSTVTPPATQTITQTPTQTPTTVTQTPTAETQTPTASPTVSAIITEPISATITVPISATITVPISTATPSATLTEVIPPTLTPLTVISTTLPVTTTLLEEATATAIIIEQPTIIVPTIEPTAEPAQTEETTVRPTPLRNSTDIGIPSLVPDIGNLFDPRSLANACLTGMAFTASIFLFLGVLYLLKSFIRLFQ